MADDDTTPAATPAKQVADLLDGDLHAVLENLRRAAADRRPSTEPRPERPLRKTSAPTQELLPYWRDEDRPAIHYLIRSALFTCASTTPRRMIKSDNIESLGYFRLGFQGEELRQKELDLLMQLLHIKRGQAPDAFTRFQPMALIRALGWTTGARSYKELAESLLRMQACSITVAAVGEVETVSYSGTIVLDFVRREEGDPRNGEWGVRLNPHLAKLLVPGGYTSLEWATRLKLSPLAKGLSAYFLSHRNTYPVGVDLLYRLSGVRYAEPRKFKRDLAKALTTLVETGILADFRIDSAGLVHVTRPAADSASGSD